MEAIKSYATPLSVIGVLRGVALHSLLALLALVCFSASAQAQVCGDFLCDLGEELSCPEDCGAVGVCGDFVCDPGEELSCPEDCGGGPICGDGVCDPGEQEFCTLDCFGNGFCGDGVLDSGEACDDGSANGTTACGCTTNCTVSALGTSCDDGIFCNGSETCNGAGQCDSTGSPCSSGTPICDEEFSRCVSCLDDQDCGSGEVCDAELFECAIDTDGDEVPDVYDEDDDNDGVDDEFDVDPLDAFRCRDVDADTCDDCSVTGDDESGGDTADDGPDYNQDGTCDVSDCPPDFDDCDGKFVNGCEVSLSEASSCGSCGNDCTSLNHVATAACTAQACEIIACDEASFDCDGVAQNGCESSQPCAFCGDGIVQQGEDCDNGEGNGAPGCGCANDCTFPPVMATCTDNVFCNGEETCDGAGSCASSGPACDEDEFCDEQNFQCDECALDEHCDDGLACNGVETCNANGSCRVGLSVFCGANEACVDPIGDCECVEGFVEDNVTGDCIPEECTGAGDCEAQFGAPAVCQQYACQNFQCEIEDRASDVRCANADFCDGTESCNAGACVSAGNPCDTGDVCNEFSDSCVECITEAECGGDDLCSPEGICVECNSVADCAAPGNECQQVACNVGVCEYSDKQIGTACTSDGVACNGTEACLDGGSGVLCASTGSDPCVENTDNPVCTNTGSDLFECVGSCGDGFVGVGEACDLGESLNDDDAQASSCSQSCEVNEGWVCPGGADSCDAPVADCGDGIIIASEEVCDSGSANGTTSCGCNASCDYPQAAKPCNDGLFCTTGDACDGFGTCAAGSGSPCGLGDDACREETRSCDVCLTATDCDDSNPCNGSESCNGGLGVCEPGTPVSCNGELSCSEQSGLCACPSGEAEVETGVCEPIQCSGDGDCDDNNVCNGTETCNVGIGQCVAGTPLSCGDAIACNGIETCDAIAGCTPGNPVACGTDAECVEPAGSCELLCGNGALDDGEQCDDGENNSDADADACRLNCELPSCGDEVQDSGEQCDDGNGVAGDGCSVNCLLEECSVATQDTDCPEAGVCERANCVAGACFYNNLPAGATTSGCESDGVFCNGPESCDGSGACDRDNDPCVNPNRPLCDEARERCSVCLDAADCDDGAFCNGAEVCNGAGDCESVAPVTCDAGFRCDEDADQCVTLCGNGICEQVESFETCKVDCATGNEDSDGDGIVDAVEDQLGTLPGESDSDGDGVDDDKEVVDVNNPRDTDGDNIIDALDEDDDGDGIDTIDEDVDGDGDPTNDDTDEDSIPNYLDDDDDDDRVPSEIEAFGFGTAVVRKQTGGLLLDSDDNGVPNYLDNDDDGDTILTANEAPGNSSPWLNDTDGDGIPNYVDDDDDDDTILTADEVRDFPGDFDRDGKANYLDDDDDGDGVLTATELTVYGSRAFDTDTDDDGLLDGDEVRLGTILTDDDSDDDLLLDGREVQLNADPLDSDTDDDRLLDGEEVDKYGTGVRNYDTDDDLLSDGEEVLDYGTDPLDNDSDDDGLLDGEEIALGLDPLSKDTDGDGILDSEEGVVGTAEGGSCATTSTSATSLAAIFLAMVALVGLRRRKRETGSDV